MSTPLKNGVGRASFVPALTASSIVVGACAALLVLTPMAASAQQSGGARAPISNGGSHTMVEGGTAGASNRAGAGGLMNPSPGGSRSEAGEPGSSAGPTGTTTQRSGYLGGRETTTEGGADTGTSTTNTVNVVVPRGSGSEVNCHDFSPSDLTPTARLSGQNMVRIENVRALIGEGVASRASPRPSRYLLANFQEELAKTHPDLAAAGTYLGIASQESVTPQVVLRVSRILCVPMNESEAASISSVAEQQRLRLKER